MSAAIRGGLFHPNCKDSTSTYYEGITTLKKATDEDIDDMKRREALEQQKSYFENQAKKNARIARYSLDAGNKRMYRHRAEESRKKADIIGKRLENEVAKSEKSGIIKSLDVDDYNLMVLGTGIEDEVNSCIVSSIKKQEKANKFIISEISVRKIPKNNHGTPVLQIEPLPNGLL